LSPSSFLLLTFASRRVFLMHKLDVAYGDNVAPNPLQLQGYLDAKVLAMPPGKTATVGLINQFCQRAGVQNVTWPGALHSAHQAGYARFRSSCAYGLMFVNAR
jgi:hypothetical protein